MNGTGLRTIVMLRKGKAAKALQNAKLEVRRLEALVSQLDFQSDCSHEFSSDQSGMQVITYTCTKCGFEVED
jgi:hypothetical protein